MSSPNENFHPAHAFMQCIFWCVRLVTFVYETFDNVQARLITLGVLVEQISDLTTEIDTLTGDLGNSPQK